MQAQVCSPDGAVTVGVIMVDMADTMGEEVEDGEVMEEEAAAAAEVMEVVEEGVEEDVD